MEPGIRLGYSLNDRVSNLDRIEVIFSVTSRWAMGLTQLPVPWIPVLKQPGCESDNFSLVARLRISGAIILFPVRLHGVPQIQQLEVSPWELLYKFHLFHRKNTYHTTNIMISVNIHTDNTIEIVVCFVYKIRIFVCFSHNFLPFKRL